MRMNQKTIRNEIRVSGIGLHSGNDSRVVIRPSGMDHGLKIISISDGKIAGEFPATIGSTINGSFKTAIGIGSVTVDTIEHLMAALCACGITSADIEVHGTEIPALDGTATIWMDLIRSAGVSSLDGYIDPIIVKNVIRVGTDTAWCSLEPCDHFELIYELGYDHPMLRHQVARLELDENSFLQEIAPARTFGFYSDLAELRQAGLANGADLSNTLVFNDDGVINPDGMRWPNEPARHKLMDAIGDLYLAGKPIIGRFRGYHSGHQMNHDLVRKLLGSLDDVACLAQ